jgi:hypothetical protein
MERRFGIVADPACHDWQRLFRLPRATRDAKPENWPTWGNANAIGCLSIRASATDVASAARRADKVFRQRNHADFVPSIASGEGLLFWLLRARGDVADRPCPRGGWIVRCPNRAQHSSNTDGTDSTILFPPVVGKELGAIACKHGHCQHITVKCWLRFFSDGELSAARVAAGITRAA